MITPAAVEAKLATFNADELRAIILHLAAHRLCTVMSALDWADWHRAHPELCAPVNAGADQGRTPGPGEVA